MPTTVVQKVTVSLPEELITFADMKAAQRGVSRSRFIAELLAEYKLGEKDILAAEGYEFFAQEAEEFAAATQNATKESWDNDR